MQHQEALAPQHSFVLVGFGAGAASFGRSRDKTSKKRGGFSSDLYLKKERKTSRGILRSEIFQNFFYSKKLWSTWLELEPSSWLAGAGSKWNGSPTTLAKYMENCAQEISSIFRSDVRMPICFRHAKVFLNIKMWKKWPLCISDHHVQCQMTGRTGGFTK